MTEIQVGDLVEFNKVGTESQARVENIRTNMTRSGIPQAFLRSSNHEWDPRWMSVSKLTFVSRPRPAPETNTDHAALLAIQELMDGVEWNGATLDAIARILVNAGYIVRDLGE
jgi:hypothetical protein